VKWNTFLHGNVGTGPLAQRMSLANQTSIKLTMFSFQYADEHDLPYVMALVDAELSEPYSIFTYRYGGGWEVGRERCVKRQNSPLLNRSILTIHPIPVRSPPSLSLSLLLLLSQLFPPELAPPLLPGL